MFLSPSAVPSARSDLLVNGGRYSLLPRASLLCRTDPISVASEPEDEPDDQGNESEPEQAPSDASTDELCLKASSPQNTWPSNWTQAMKRSDAEEWRNAAQAEIDAHITNGT